MTQCYKCGEWFSIVECKLIYDLDLKAKYICKYCIHNLRIDQQRISKSNAVSQKL